MKLSLPSEQFIDSGPDGVEVPQVKVEKENGLFRCLLPEIIEHSLCPVRRTRGDVHPGALQEQHLFNESTTISEKRRRAVFQREMPHSRDRLPYIAMTSSD